MHDIRLIRDDPDAFDRGLARRGLTPQSGRLLAIDERRREIIGRLQAIQERRNAASKEVGQAKAAKDEARAAALIEEVARLKQDAPAAEAEQKAIEEELTATLAEIPNIPLAEVPDGPDESANVELHRIGSPREIHDAKAHYELGEALGLIDFEAAARMSGARFAVLKGQVARLERALASFMLDLHTGEHGYTEIAPPLLVRDEAMFGTGQLPKFADDSFRTTDGRWLIPTAEVSLTNLSGGQILAEAELPLRFTALTSCFRSEAGAAGRDTRGLIRQHQFEKVELVAIAAPECSDDEHERMTRAAEGILEALELPYRRMLLCAGDMGFTARKTFDLEVWLPGQQTYREISSCSNCGDFQARRMDARYRPAEAATGKGATAFVHTLNGSGLAVGRTLVAVIENYQQADGSVAVPEVLRPYMGGLERLLPA
jgi:seryl-tRNA synthetase